MTLPVKDLLKYPPPGGERQAVQRVDALQKANKPFDRMMVPGRNHGLFGGKTRLNLFEKATAYIKANL